LKEVLQNTKVAVWQLLLESSKLETKLDVLSPQSQGFHSLLEVFKIQAS